MTSIYEHFDSLHKLMRQYPIFIALYRKEIHTNDDIDDPRVMEKLSIITWECWQEIGITRFLPPQMHEAMQMFMDLPEHCPQNLRDGISILAWFMLSTTPETYFLETAGTSLAHVPTRLTSVEAVQPNTVNSVVDCLIDLVLMEEANDTTSIQ